VWRGGCSGVAGAGDAAQEIIYPCLVVYASFPVCGRGETVDARDLKTDFLYLRRPAADSLNCPSKQWLKQSRVRALPAIIRAPGAI